MLSSLDFVARPFGMACTGNCGTLYTRVETPQDNLSKQDAPVLDL